MYNPVEVGDPDEPVEIRNLSKSKLYSLLEDELLLPSKESRGVTRAYLVQVYRRTVFTVNRRDIMHFEARLSLAEKRKNAFYCVSLLTEKLDILLPMLGLLPLGFPQNVSPEEDWFSRVLRYVDPFNLLEAFQRRVEGAAPPPIFLSRV